MYFDVVIGNQYKTQFNFESRRDLRVVDQEMCDILSIVRRYNPDYISLFSNRKNTY